MKRIIVASSIFFASLSSFAESDLLAGKFRHQFTKDKGTAVWEIKINGVQCQLLTLGAPEAPIKCHELSDPERRAFWKSMWWPEESSGSAKCVGGAKEVFCHLPRKSIGAIDDLKSHTSNYFHFDPIGGLMEVQKLSK